MKLLKFYSFNLLDSFITAALTILVPLSLASRGMEIAAIGGVVALVPVVFTLSRAVFASIADGIGTKPFFILNAAANTASSFLYMNAFSPTAYLSGRFLEGLRGGSIWAVNRLEAKMLTVERKVETEFSKLVSLRMFGFVAGTLGAGFLVSGMDFEGAFFLLGGVSLTAFALSFAIGSGWFRRESIRRVFGRLDVRKKDASTIKAMLCIIPGLPATTLVLSLLLPLYLSFAGFDYWQIGTGIALYYLASATLVWGMLKRGWGGRKLCIFGAVFYLVGLALVIVRGFEMPAILIMGIGDGFFSITWENMMAFGTKKSREIAADVGIMHVPSHMFSSVALVLCGVAVSLFGFGAGFAMSGVLILSYFWLVSGCLE